MRFLKQYDQTYSLKNGLTGGRSSVNCHQCTRKKFPCYRGKNMVQGRLARRKELHLKDPGKEWEKMDR